VIRQKTLFEEEKETTEENKKSVVNINEIDIMYQLL